MNYLYYFSLIDGLVGTDFVVEIKCPFTAKDSSSLIEAVINKKVKLNNSYLKYGVIICTKCLNII